MALSPSAASSARRLANARNSVTDRPQTSSQREDQRQPSAAVGIGQPGDRRRVGRADRQGEHHRGQRECEPAADAPARDRPVPLDRMQPVARAIEPIVDHVHRARHRAERHEREHRGLHALGIVPGVRKQQADQHEGVLSPLVGAQQPQHGERQARPTRGGSGGGFGVQRWHARSGK
jgi:hypothetical protein